MLKKTYFITFFFIFLFFYQNTYAQEKIVFVDINYVFNNSTVGKNISDPEKFPSLLNQLFPFLPLPLLCFFEIIQVGLDKPFILLLASSFVLSTESSQITLLFRKCVAILFNKLSSLLPNE